MSKKTVLAFLLSAAVIGSSVPLTVTANASDVVYGTMEIPYSEFYSSEDIDGVETVSSATTNKWKNENLVKGTYSVETENGGGDILGVKYYVAVSADDLEKLDESYHFEKVDEVPQAYKNVTVENGKAVFSEIVGDTTTEENEVTMNINMVWGDYVLDVSGLNNSGGTSEFGTIYGVILETSEGDKYGMRHLENIWRDEIAWSSGIKKSEPHGNVLNYEQYVGLMGQTLTGITFITETGYHTVPVDIYIPVKFENTVEIADCNINDISTTFTATGFPEDYEKVYFVSGNGQFSIEDGFINYQVEFPGTYNLEISDANGKYATVNTSFVISTDDMPAEFDGEKLVPAENASQADFEAFIRNISSVTVDENTYSATGKRGVKIIADDGTVIKDAAMRDTLIFAEDKPYNIIITATGYNKTLEFVLNDDTKKEESSEPSEVSEVSEISEVSENPEVSEVSQVSENSEISQNSEASQISEISENSQTSISDNNNSNTNNNSNVNNNTNYNSNAVNTGSSNFALATILAAVISALAAFFSFKKKYN